MKKTETRGMESLFMGFIWRGISQLMLSSMIQYRQILMNGGGSLLENRSQCFPVAEVERVNAPGVRELKSWQVYHTPAQTVLLLTCVAGAGFPVMPGTRGVSSWQHRVATLFHGLAGGLDAAAPVVEVSLKCVYFLVSNFVI